MKIKVLIFFLISNIIYSQVSFENSPYEKTYTTEQNTIAQNWEDYVNSFRENSDGNCIYWKTSDLNKTGCNLLQTQGFYNPSLFKLPFKNQILSILKNEDECFELSSIFYMINEKSELNPFAIVKVYVEKIGDNYYFKDNLNRNTKNWESKKVGLINYYFPKTYNFRSKNAEEASKFLNNLNKTFDLDKTNSINYFIAEKCAEVFKISGFDFAPNINTEKCAFYDIKNDIVYTSKFYGEFHKHELIHLINKKYPQAHYLLNTGLSIYNGGENVHKDYNFKTLLQKFNNYYIQNSNVTLDLFNLNNFEKDIQIDYLIGAIIDDAILEKGGLTLLKETLTNVKTDEDLYSFIKNNLLNKNESVSDWLKRRAKLMTLKDFKFKIDL
ncbi:hypothetical protein [Halpernia frigidisoli]|uniref:Uncharacterized protein n=1 Tax=Halpernia frigidisoli TaxID=1125876 RepID=A0A1I3HXA7_9FLAO|nr:hypothetical protein [Halpernia frigidisoli]SFI40217.1 hypothetical protein SAMN05443292_2436 [Halpernia frigidisoli]